MQVSEALGSVQFVVDAKGKPTAALLNIEAWRTLISWIEDITDSKIAHEALSALQAAGGRPHQAGWLAWDDIKEAWDDEEDIQNETTTI